MEVKKKLRRWTRESTEQALTEMIEAICSDDPNFRIQAWEIKMGYGRCSLRYYCRKFGLLPQYLKAKSTYEMKREYGDRPV